MPSLTAAVDTPESVDGFSWGRHRDFERQRWWQNGWRVLLAWALGCGFWLFLAALIVAGVPSEDIDPRLSQDGVLSVVLLDLVLGHVAVLLVAFRRRAPFPIALIITLLCAVSMAAIPASGLAIISLATHRHLPSLLSIIGISLAADLFYELVMSPFLGVATDISIEGESVMQGSVATLINLGIASLIYLVCALIGWNAGSRRELLRSWRTQAETAQREQAARVSQAQLAERARIAREMHDVLAHRLSLVAMHAGVLAHRSDLSAPERAEAAEVIRAGAHEALEELREVLGVLRADEVADSGADAAAPGGSGRPVEAPQPGLSGIPSLVAEVTTGGQEVRLVADEDLWPASLTLPTSTGRHAYRVVQEALTNARKHAEGRPVTVRLDGREGQGLDIEIRNRLGRTRGATLPTGGRGLTGMTERVTLAGGRIDVGPEVSDFVVRVWLPWPERDGAAGRGEQDGRDR